jgi:MFS family permease
MDMPLGTMAGTRPGFLSRENTVAGPGFNRWLVPPAALAIHLCIGMIYGMSVFWLPVAQAVGISHPVACPAGTNMLFAAGCDWQLGDLKEIFTIAIVVLGVSAALLGGWLERAGPRKAGLVAAICWPGGLALTAIGVHVHQLWLMWLGGGVIGGIGLGLGYISPVSTLIKWFPDRRGMATGMAIMGFGGGAMIGAPLATMLIAHFHTATDVGVWQTMLVMAALYAVFMFGGALGYRVPPEGWRPAGYMPLARPGLRHDDHGSVHVNDAHKTVQFWLLWAVLCLNVTAGIGVLEMASPMLQEIFGGSLIGQAAVFTQLSADQHKAVAAIAAGFVGFLSLFNILGRFFWSSVSDRIGRKVTYGIFFALGILLYGLAPSLAQMGSRALFATAFAVILSMYGGGFATIPAYLADVFGAGFVGAIHGRILTAWSAAGFFGPEIVNSIRERQLAAGVPRAQVYNETMYILAGLLAVGFVCNLLVRAVDGRWFTVRSASGTVAQPTAVVGSAGGFNIALIPAWLVVCVPLCWGLYETVLKAAALFR